MVASSLETGRNHCRSKAEDPVKLMNEHVIFCLIRIKSVKTNICGFKGSYRLFLGRKPVPVFGLYGSSELWLNISTVVSIFSSHSQRNQRRKCQAMTSSRRLTYSEFPAVRSQRLQTPTILCTTNLDFTQNEILFFAKYFYYYFSNLYLFIRRDIYNNKM